jgi:hypothetical protein
MSETSIRARIALGAHITPDTASPLPAHAATAATVCLHHHGLLITGPAGSGRTNLLMHTTLQLARTTDAVIWAAGTFAHFLASGWTHPIATGRIPPIPLLDWAADTTPYLDGMLTAARNVIDARRTGYLKEATATGILTATPHLPAIVLVIDFNQLPARLHKAVGYVVAHGRTARITITGAAYRPTPDVVPAAFLRTVRQRVAMTYSADEDFFLAFGEHPKHERQAVGEALHRDDRGFLRAFSTPRITQTDIDTATRVLGARRPVLDRISRDATTGTGYTDRWHAYLDNAFPGVPHPANVDDTEDGTR